MAEKLFKGLVVAALVAMVVHFASSVEEGKAASGADGKEKVEETLKAIRVLVTALEMYKIDNKVYPPSTNDPSVRIKAMKSPDDVPTFDAPRLTTPIAYLTKMPADPFSTATASFAFTHFSDPDNWLIWSPGPDGVYDVNWTEFATDENAPRPEFYAKYAYDVTNGSISNGDIFRARSEIGRPWPPK